jgi:hypothetical protein
VAVTLVRVVCLIQMVSSSLASISPDLLNSAASRLIRLHLIVDPDNENGVNEVCAKSNLLQTSPNCTFDSMRPI